MRTLTQIPTMEWLLRLGEEDALRAHFDARNCRMLFRLLLVCALMALAAAVAMAIEQQLRDLAVPAVNLVVIRSLFMLRERDVFTRYFNAFLVAFLVIQGLLWRLMFPEWLGLWHPAHFLAPTLLIFFHLPPGLAIAPLGASWALGVGRHLGLAAVTNVELDYGFVIAQSLLCAAVYAIVSHWTRLQRSAFLVDWRRERHRHQEKRRMEEELDKARRIQLSMLPRSEPVVSWLDTAGISIPASEVGGDYYGYFTISETRQAVVVGDVAGHGVGSGIMLSAVRSGLYLLHEEPIEPVDVLSKIDRMLRQTSVQRNFVTLFYAAFDYEAMTLTYSAAGHPPVLCLRGSGVEELALYALPLGTRIGSRIRQRTASIHPGDVFVFFTDGIAETVNTRGDLYGDRLRQRLAGMSRERTARDIRDTVLGDVWSFKGDGMQLDDITIVVVKVL